MDQFDQDLELALQLSLQEAQEQQKKNYQEQTSTVEEMGNKISSFRLNENSVYTIETTPELLGEFIRPGCTEFWTNKEYSDITLVLGKEEKLLAHRIVLCSWSETFRIMLENEVWKESQQQELPINIEDKEIPVFKKLIEYMYTGNISVVDDDVISLLGLANYYGVFSLKDQCSEILGTLVDIDSVFELLDVARQYSCNQLEIDCAEFLADNFEEMYKKDKLNSLDVDTWVKMLESDEIKVSSEDEVLHAVLKYVEQFKGEERNSALEKLLPQVRLPLLPTESLIEHLEENESLKGVKNLHTLLHETYRYKAYPDAAPKLFKVTARRGTSAFDSEYCHPSVQISRDRLTATNTSSAWVNARCIPAFASGISYKEITVKFASYIMIGIETKLNAVKTMNSYAGSTAFGWSWYNTGQIYHANSHSNAMNGNQTITFASGDTIGMLFDSNSGTLVFYKNGKPTKATIQVNEKEVYPVVSFYSPSDSATIVNTGKLPAKMPKKDNFATTNVEFSKIPKKPRKPSVLKKQ